MNDRWSFSYATRFLVDSWEPPRSKEFATGPESGIRKVPHCRKTRPALMSHSPFGHLVAILLEGIQTMPMLRITLIGLLALAIQPVSADDPKPDDAIKQGRQLRLDFMKAKLAEFTLEAEGPPMVPLKLADEPSLRWTNPIRGVDGDGATFFWSDGSRPVAVATVSIRSEGKVFREFALLGDRPIAANRGGRSVWSPRKNSIPFGPIADAPDPSKTPNQRLTQPGLKPWAPAVPASASSRGSRWKAG